MPASVRPRRSCRLIRSHGSASPRSKRCGWRRRIFALEPVGHVVGDELAALLGDHQLKGQVQQQVAQLVPDRVGVALAQRVVQLQHLLDQVGAQRLAGLRPVPGAARSGGRAPSPGHVQALNCLAFIPRARI